MANKLENKSPKIMVSYLEDVEILELLEESEDDERWSEEQIDCQSLEELSSSDISDDDEDTSTIFISRNKKENWPATLPIHITLAELLVLTYITTDQALHALQHCNAIQFLIHSDYFLETNCLKKFVIGQMLKDFLFTKTSGLL